MDCTIVAFYAQAKIQIQMLRYNLEQLVECGDTENISTLMKRPIQYTVYKDEAQEKAKLQERFKNCVLHYDQIVR